VAAAAPAPDAEVASAAALGEEDLGQLIFGRLLERLRGDAAAAGELLGAGARVRVDDEERRGPELLVDLLQADTAFRGRQVRGDVTAVAPLHTAVLDYELPDGTLARRHVVAIIEGGRITELSLYRSTPAAAPAVTG
jgi:hypothetical protein